MNIIRTKAIELSTVPAIAYKQKLSSGGAGLKLLRIDIDRTAVCSIDKRTGEMRPYGPLDETLFPLEAFDEAFELTAGLPYSARGTIKVAPVELQIGDVDESALPEQLDMTLSPEYLAIVERYSDEKGKINYTLMNKDFIQFAAKSKTVADMVGDMESPSEILNAIVRSRATLIANQKHSLSPKEVELLIETLDEIDPRNAFKELNAYIKRLLAKSKRP